MENITMREMKEKNVSLGVNELFFPSPFKNTRRFSKLKFNMRYLFVLS